MRSKGTLAARQSASTCVQTGVEPDEDHIVLGDEGRTDVLDALAIVEHDPSDKRVDIRPGHVRPEAFCDEGRGDLHLARRYESTAAVTSGVTLSLLYRALREPGDERAAVHAELAVRPRKVSLDRLRAS